MAHPSAPASSQTLPHSGSQYHQPPASPPQPQAQAQAQAQQTQAQQLPQQPQQPAAPDGTGFGIASFVLGLVSITSGLFVGPIVGLVLGLMARKRPNAHPALTTWGIWLNAICLVFWSLLALTVIVVMIMAIAIGGAAVFSVPFMS